MTDILADRQIKALIGSVLLEADDELVDPNGIELRLGRFVHFHSTGEDVELQPDNFLKVFPGESIVISSLEVVDFTKQTVQAELPGKMLMGLVTPTTTMMREGISQVTTKVDAGFRGRLNWSLRNGSTKDLILRHGEPIFKLTLFALNEDESPDALYGERAKDAYQDTEGIRRSARQVPADIPKAALVSSSFSQLDPKKQLLEAGYPFNHIGIELTALHDKFGVVSSDVRLMKEEFQRQTDDLSDKIQLETTTLTEKLEQTRKTMLITVESLFDRKFLRAGGAIIGAIPIMYGGVTYLQQTTVGGNAIAFLSMLAGVVIVLVSYLLAKRTH